MLQFLVHMTICIAGALSVACAVGIVGIAGYTYQQRKLAKQASVTLLKSFARKP